jgi:RND family efflux transporter MFP subunit
LARATLTRWKQMADKGVVTPQELEERNAAANVTEANVRAARASVANLREVLRFGALVAPFRGVVTARSIDIGSLVVAGAATGARPLFTLVQTDTVRVMLQVPQSAAARVHTGMKASIGVRELGDSAFAGSVVRTAGAMDPLTRTLLTEVQVPNASRRLLPGMFANVRLAVPNPRGLVRIPAIALIVRGDGPQVAQVVNDTVHLVPIGLGRDFGTSLEVVRGIAPGAAVVVNPPENLVSGMPVKAIARGAAKQ